MYIFTAWNFRDDCPFSFGHCIVCRLIYEFGIYKRFLSKSCPHNSTILCTGNSIDKTLNCQWSRNCYPFIGALATESSHMGFSGVLVTRSLVLCVMFCRSLCVPLSFFFRPLYCLSFYLRILITPLASSNSFLETHNPCIGKMVSFQLFNDACNY
jgi:hypothetical protein